MNKLFVLLLFFPLFSWSQTFKVVSAYVSEEVDGEETTSFVDFAPNLFATFSSIAIITSSSSGEGNGTFEVENYEFDKTDGSKRYKTKTVEGNTVYFTLMKDMGFFMCRWEGDNKIYGFAISVPNE